MRRLKRKKFSEHLQSAIPILKWLPEYKLQYLPTDIVAGITVGIYNVPQAMAYAVLAGLPPVVGLYSSFFPPLIYAIFGTSPQVSIGMFSVTALMVGSVNDRLAITSNNTESTNIGAGLNKDSSVQVSTTMDFTIGIILGLMSIFRLHFLVSYMSNELVSGYTTGAACHVLATQLPKIFGISVPRRTGFLKLYYILKDIVVSVKMTKLPDLITSFVCIGILHIGKWYINPRFKSKSGIPLPFELVLIIITTVLSTVLDAQNKYQMEIVANIPTGFPVPSLPAFHRIPDVIFDSLVTALVIYAITISICKVICQSNRSSIDAKQELCALALVEFIISFFCCHPACGSLTRTVINTHCDAKTQVSSIISASLMALAILWMAQLLKPLPKCVLSAIIVVALETMFLQIKQLKKLWKISKVDMAIWVVAFLATVIWDVSQGLGVAVAFALITVIFRTQWPKTVQLLNVEKSTTFGNEGRCRSESVRRLLLQKVMLYRFDASLLFLNVDHFKRNIYNLVEASDNSKKPVTDSQTNRINAEGDEERGTPMTKQTRYLVLDASGLNEIDYQGVLCLKEVAEHLRKYYIEFIVADAKAHVLEKFKLCDIEGAIPKQNTFKSITDALEHVAEAEVMTPMLQEGNEPDATA